MYLLRENVEKSVSVTFADASTTFIQLLKKQDGIGFFMLTGFLGEAIGSISAEARLWIGGLAKVLFGCRRFFSIDFALCDNLLLLSLPGENCLKCVSAFIRQPPLSAQVTSGLREKFFDRVSWENLLRKHGFLGRFSFPHSLFFTWQTVVNFWNLAALRLHSLYNAWRLLTFEMTRFYFSTKFCSKLG